MCGEAWMLHQPLYLILYLVQGVKILKKSLGFHGFCSLESDYSVTKREFISPLSSLVNSFWKSDVSDGGRCTESGTALPLYSIGWSRRDGERNGIVQYVNLKKIFSTWCCFCNSNVSSIEKISFPFSLILGNCMDCLWAQCTIWKPLKEARSSSGSSWLFSLWVGWSPHSRVNTSLAFKNRGLTVGLVGSNTLTLQMGKDHMQMDNFIQHLVYSCMSPLLQLN